MTLYKQRERFQALSIKIGIIFSKLPITPNQWTLLSIIPAILASFLVAKELFLDAALLFLVSAFLDLVDGSVARVTKTASKFGAYLDTIVDRYVEAIIVFGLLLTALPSFLIQTKVWIFLYFFGAMMTTYAKAAAKEKEIIPEGKELKGGLLERAERLIILFVGILLAAVEPIYLVYVIALLAILANVSALQRILIAKNLATRK